MNADRLRIWMRAVRFLLACAAVLPLAGCWDRTEVNDLALITAAGLDKKGEEIELSVQLFVPRMQSGQEQGLNGNGGGMAGQTIMRSARGVTVADAMSKLQEVLPRRVFWGHCEVFILDRELAGAGIRKHVDFMMRHPQVREGSFIFISKEKSKEILALLPPIERSSAEVLREMAKSENEMRVTLKDLLMMLSGDAGAAALPWVEIHSDPDQKGKPAIPYISGTAIFKNDNLIGHIGDHLTRGVLWLRGEIKTATVTVAPKGKSQGYVSANLLKAHTELIPSIKDGKWSLTLKADTDNDIVQNETNLDLTQPHFTKMMETELKADLRDTINGSLDQVQKTMKADILGFSEAFHRKYPKEWNKVKDRWEEVFPEVEVRMELNAHIRRTGKSAVQAEMPQSEVREK